MKKTRAFAVLSDEQVKSIKKDKHDPFYILLCPHCIIKKGEKRSSLVEYEPTPNEEEKIKSDLMFSEFDRIDSIEICTSIKMCRLCGTIVVHESIETK